MVSPDEESRLRYTMERVSPSTIKRDYARWRRKHGILDRCDMSGCHFQTAPLIWNGQSLTLILDHISGVNSDNRPENLRYLCPNCNSSLPTHGGGGNKYRVEKSRGGFALRRKDGKKDYTLVAESGAYEIKQETAIIVSLILVTTESATNKNKGG